MQCNEVKLANVDNINNTSIDKFIIQYVFFMWVFIDKYFILVHSWKNDQKHSKGKEILYWSYSNHLHPTKSLVKSQLLCHEIHRIQKEVTAWTVPFYQLTFNKVELGIIAFFVENLGWQELLMYWNIIQKLHEQRVWELSVQVPPVAELINMV